MASSGIHFDARHYIVFGTRQLDVPVFQSWYSLSNSNPVPFASNAIALSTQLMSPDCHLLVRWGERYWDQVSEWTSTLRCKYIQLTSPK